MKRGIFPAAFVLLVSLAQVVFAGPPGKERGKELAALEQKIVGAWKGQNGCAGNFLFRADGTYELKRYGPGGDDFAGAWKVRWDALPPTLVLTCKTSDIPEELGKLKLIQLNDEILEAQYSKQGVNRYARVKVICPRVSAKEPVCIDSQYPVWEIVCSQDGMRLAVAGLARQDGVGTGIIRVLEIPTTKERFRLTDQNFPPRFAFAPDGKTVAVISAVSHSQGNVHIWDVGAGKKRHTLGSDTIHGGLVFSPDSKTLISLSVDQKQARGRIFLWEAATGKKRRDFEAPGAKKPWGFYQCALSPDGKKLAIHDSSLEIYGTDYEKGMFTTIQARGNSSLGIWDAVTGKELTQIKDHRFGFSDFVFSPDAQTLVTLGCLSTPIASAQANVKIQGARIIDGKWYAGENSIVLRNANTGKEIRRFAEKRSENLIFRHIALSADGRTLAGGGSDGVIYLWDVATGKEIQQLKNHQADLAQKDGWTLAGIVLAFTPDGKRLVSAANKRVLIWDIQAAVK
jgi:WD40 repeat protein